MDTQIVYEQLQYTVWRVSYSNQIPSRYAQNRIWADSLIEALEWVVGWFWSCLLGQFVWHITKNFCVCFWTFIVNTFDTPVGNFIFFTPGNKCSELLTPLSHHLIFTPSAGKFGAVLCCSKHIWGPFSAVDTPLAPLQQVRLNLNQITVLTETLSVHGSYYNKGFRKWAQVWTKHNRLFN